MNKIYNRKWQMGVPPFLRVRSSLRNNPISQTTTAKADTTNPNMEETI